MSGEAKPGITRNTKSKQFGCGQSQDFVTSGALDATGTASLGSLADTVDDGSGSATVAVVASGAVVEDCG
jgi:hypothetical protein